VIDRAIGIAGLALALVFPVLPFMSARVNKAVVWSGCVLGLLLVGLSAGLLFMPVDAQTPPTVQQSNTGAPNINASGNGNQFYLVAAAGRRRLGSGWADATGWRRKPIHRCWAGGWQHQHDI